MMSCVGVVVNWFGYVSSPSMSVYLSSPGYSFQYALHAAPSVQLSCRYRYATKAKAIMLMLITVVLRAHLNTYLLSEFVNWPLARVQYPISCCTTGPDIIAYFSDKRMPPSANAAYATTLVFSCSVMLTVWNCSYDMKLVTLELNKLLPSLRLSMRPVWLLPRKNRRSSSSSISRRSIYVRKCILKLFKHIQC